MAYLKRFFAGVLSYVRSQNAGSRERLAAIDAFVWTFAAVHLLSTAHLSFRPHRLHAAQ